MIRPVRILLLLALLTPTASAQEWGWLNPLPQGNLLRCVAFSDATHGCAVGSNGSIVFTLDGGTSWTNGNSGTSQTILSCAYSAPTTVWVGGPYGLLMKTTNRGASWTTVTTGQLDSMASILFTDSSNGVIVGSSGVIIVTVDGGATWNFRADPLARNLWSVATGPLQSFVAAGDSGTIVRSVNGGTTWDTTNAGVLTKRNLLCVAFADPGVAVACGASGRILRSSDGGATWDTIPSGVTNSLQSVRFVNSTTGLIVGRTVGGGNGMILKTTDRGLTWALDTVGAGAFSFYSLAILSPNSAVIAGSGGMLEQTTDGGSSWTHRATGFFRSVTGLAAPAPGVIVASTGAGIIERSTNGGASWSEPATGIGANLRAVKFWNANLGVAVGDSGRVVRTTDGGASWAAAVDSATTSMACIAMPAANRWVAAGASGMTVTSTDSGRTWLKHATGGSLTLNCIAFADGDTGIAAGATFSGRIAIAIYRTTDKGSTWTLLTTTLPGTFPQGALFLNSKRGFIVGGTQSGQIFRTVDAGANWLVDSSLAVGATFAAITSSDSANVIVAGSTGREVVSSDGGDTWRPIPPITAGNIAALAAAAGKTVYAGGTGGIVLSSSNPYALPIELMTFTGEPRGNAVALNWTTATETKNYGFGIERATGDEPFSSIGFVPGHGTTGMRNEYAYTDAGLTPGTYRYRLRQTDVDGSTHLSNEIEIDLQPITPGTFSFYPNPASGSATFLLPPSLPNGATLRIADALGRTVLDLTPRVSAGAQAIDAGLGALESGAYMVQFRTPQSSFTRPLMLVR